MKTQVMGLRFVFVFQCVDGVFRIGLKNGILRSQNKWKQICRYMDKSQLAIYLCLSTLRNAIDKQSTITSHK